MSPDVERTLMDYLAEGRIERIKVSDKVDHATNAIGNVLNQLQLHEHKDDARFGEVKAAIAGVYSRLDDLERDAEDTGRYNLEELRAKLKRKEEAEDARLSWWARFGVQTMVTVGLAMFTGLIGALFAFLAGRH